MKTILLISSIFILTSITAQNPIWDSTNTQKKDFDTTIVQDFIVLNNNIVIDTAVLSKIESIQDNLQEIKKEVSSKSSITDYLPIFVALIAGLLALFQVKANIISSARIEWTQNLRKTVSSFLAEVMILNYNLRKVLDLTNAGKNSDAKILYDQQTENFKKVFEYGNQIKLFLNNKDETEHTDLQIIIEDYLDKSTHGKDATEIENLEEKQKEIISKSQDILKKAWEDAKTFKIKDIFKIGW